MKLLSISFDPAFDQPRHPARSRQEARRRSQRLAVRNRRRAVVDRLAAAFGINVIREKDGTITHNLRTAVIDPSGRVVSILDNNAWTAEDLARALKNAVAAAR